MLQEIIMVSNFGDETSLRIHEVISVILNTGIFDYKINEPRTIVEKKNVDCGLKFEVSALLNSINTTLRTFGI